MGTEAEWLATLKGIAGQNGTKGDNGADGKSAYEIAKDNGFTGTESEWLASLVGQSGAKGEQGIQGEKVNRVKTAVTENLLTSLP